MRFKRIINTFLKTKSKPKVYIKKKKNHFLDYKYFLIKTKTFSNIAKNFHSLVFFKIMLYYITLMFILFCYYYYC